MSGLPRAAKGEKRKSDVVDQSDPPHQKKHVAREARAAEAKVSPATMARADQIAKRPDLEEKVVAGGKRRSAGGYLTPANLFPIIHWLLVTQD